MKFSGFLVDIEVALIVDFSFLIHPQTYSVGDFRMPGNYNLPTDRLISFHFEVFSHGKCGSEFFKKWANCQDYQL